MHSLNLVVIAGNVTRKPEVRYTPRGTVVVEFGVAINRRWKNQRTGEWSEETTFVEVRLSGSQADFAAERVRKGVPVHVEGRLQLDQWQDQRTGARRERLRVFGQRLTLLGRPARPERDPKPREIQPELTESEPRSLELAAV